MRSITLLIATAAIITGLTACQSDDPPALSDQLESLLDQLAEPEAPRRAPGLPVVAPLSVDGDPPPFPQYTNSGFGNWWTDGDNALTPELVAEIAAHMAQPIQYEMGRQSTDYAPPYDSHFAREAQALDRFRSIHTPNCPEIQTGAISAMVSWECPVLIGRIFERSGRVRGTIAFAQRNYLIELTDAELAAFRDELSATSATVGAIFGQMLQDSSAGIITREQRQAMQSVPGVLGGQVLGQEIRVIDDYLALDDELRSLYREAVRNWVQAE